MKNTRLHIEQLQPQELKGLGKFSTCNGEEDLI